VEKKITNHLELYDILIYLLFTKKLIINKNLSLITQLTILSTIIIFFNNQSSSNNQSTY
jgi:hypothetical protein